MKITENQSEPMFDNASSGTKPTAGAHWVIDRVTKKGGYAVFRCSKCNEPYSISEREYGWMFGKEIPFNYCHNCGKKVGYISFVDACLAGEVSENDPEELVDAYTEYWHTHETGKELHEFLGMTADEYARWLKDGNCLREIVEERKQGNNG